MADKVEVVVSASDTYPYSFDPDEGIPTIAQVLEAVGVSLSKNDTITVVPANAYSTVINKDTKLSTTVKTYISINRADTQGGD